MLRHDTREKNYFFSIVMAIYNVEDYLAEAIDSVVNQTLSFEDHVQLILVNDGSPDNSDEICLRYKEQYPNNIVYIKKENGGVSSARNEGLKHVKGTYVNFLDSDDKLSFNACAEGFHFFNSHGDSLDVVSFPLFSFDGHKGGNELNYKYKKTAVIDLTKHYNYIQMSMSSCFIKVSVLQGLQFNTEMKYAEDAELLNKIILEKQTLGVLSNVKYFYRVRRDNSSATQQGKNQKYWYTQYLKTFSLSTIEYSLEKFSYVPKYIQYMIMYNLQHRLNLNDFNHELLTPHEQTEFFEVLARVLTYIDDEIIMQQKHLNAHRKQFALRLKYGEQYDDFRNIVYVGNNVLLTFHDKIINSLILQSLTIDLLQVNNTKLLIEGYFGSLFDKQDTEIIVKLNGIPNAVESVERHAQTIFSLGMVVKEYPGFKTIVELNPTYEPQYITFFIRIGNMEVPIPVQFKKFAKLNEIKENFFIRDNIILTSEKNQLIAQKATFRKRIIHEYKYYKKLIKTKKPEAKKAVLARLIYHALKMIKRKPVWLFMDRQDKADDNAEHLYKYASQQNDRIKKYFVIRENSKDYYKLKQSGVRVIPYRSYKHKLMHLLADKVISSHADEWVINPFFEFEKYYRDLMQFEFIFLQHGIIQNDLSSLFNKYNKNIKMIVTTAHAEWKSIRYGNYNYHDDIVKLTGLPRYDGLHNEDQRQILIMPTWREPIVKNIDSTTGKRLYSESFKTTDYFQIYNSLINDTRLIEAATRYNYRVIFFPHPNIQQQLEDFTRNKNVEFVDYHTSYQKLFNESSLLLTDYSSVFFDFAYLKKPILYFQAVKYHRDEGYFNYETMGFGEVIKEYDPLIDQIISYMENDCKMKDKYVRRVEDFYAFTDRNNCKRVYDEIIKL